MEGRIKRLQKRDSNGITKTKETTSNEDHFSKLPESIIIYILSFLEMQDVVKTSLLSKRWENLWTKVYSIVLNQEQQPFPDTLPLEEQDALFKMNNERWVSLVDKILMKCNAVIDKFCLDSDDCDFSSVIDKWMEHVLDRKVKILKLEIEGDVPGRIFQSPSVTEMELGRVRMMFDTSSVPVSLSSLKSLLLDFVEAKDEFIEKILMGSPVLETFFLFHVYDNHVIKIMSPSVKRFKLCYFRNLDETKDLVITAPWIKELEISSDFVTTRCELVDVACLIKATITFKVQYRGMYRYGVNYLDIVAEYNDKWIPMARKLMGSVAYVEELTIGSDPIQVLHVCKMSGTPSPLFKCKHLSIETCLWKFDLPGIACLLENAPQLETLFIKVLNNCQHELHSLQTRKLFQVGNPHLRMQKGKFLRLKNVKIDYVRSSCPDKLALCSTNQSHGEMFDFELVEYIVNSAVVLDKLVLCSSRSKCLLPKCPAPSCSLQWVRRLSCKLRTFLRVKKAADCDIKEKNNMHEFTFKNHASLHPTSSSL